MIYERKRKTSRVPNLVGFLSSLLHNTNQVKQVFMTFYIHVQTMQLVIHNLFQTQLKIFELVSPYLVLTLVGTFLYIDFTYHPFSINVNNLHFHPFSFLYFSFLDASISSIIVSQTFPCSKPSFLCWPFWREFWEISF